MPREEGCYGNPDWFSCESIGYYIPLIVISTFIIKTLLFMICVCVCVLVISIGDLLLSMRWGIAHGKDEVGDV